MIGSGLAGLSACWYASKFSKVDILEKENTVGIDAHSVNVRLKEGRQVRIDTPLRVIRAGYYPGLLRLYEAALIPTEVIDYSGSFCDAKRTPYFRYKNFILGRNSYSYIANSFSLSRTGRRILNDIYRFYRHGPKHTLMPEIQAMNFGEYLKRYKYSHEFSNQFILPVFAAINTCSYKAVKNYPAATIIAYLVNSQEQSGVRRITGGVGNVAKTLSGAATEIHCDAAVQYIEQKENQVVVTSTKGKQVYDYIILSTQANQAAQFCERYLPRHRELLSEFDYEKSELAVHTDLSFMPNRRSAWSPVNFLVDPVFEKPMATIYMNAIQKDLKFAEPILQTWNPHRLPAEESLIAHAKFERPLVTTETRHSLAALSELNQDPRNLVKICGSYTENGIPLLEAAAISGERIARLISCEIPEQRTAKVAT